MRGSFHGVHTEVDRIVEFPLMSMIRFEDGLITDEWATTWICSGPSATA